MSLINLFVAARSALARWRQRHRAYGELMALDDRSLADIGIRRSEIPAVIEGFHEAVEPAAPARSAAPALARVLEPALTLSRRQARLAGGHRWLPPI